MILHEFFAAAAAFDEDARARILHPDARISELPNAINRSGTERTLTEARATWKGTLAANDQELIAHIATFSEVRDGKIYRHATYDCYEPY